MSQGRKGLSSQTDHGDALRQAARINDIEKIKELLDKGAEVNTSYVHTNAPDDAETCTSHSPALGM